MKLIIGLGNPDPEYRETRHNVGWQLLDLWSKKFQVPGFKLQEKFNAEIAEGEIEGIPVALVKPHSYVNDSGAVVKKILTTWNLQPRTLIVVHDDLDVPFGHCKLSFEKHSGGHRGVQSIIKALKTMKFHRIRIGTGVRALDKARRQSEEKRDEFVKEYVLHTFTASEREELKDVFKACEVRLFQALKAK